MSIASRFSVVTLLSLVMVTMPAAAQQPDPLRGLDAYIDRARQDWGVAGLAVAIVRGDSVIYAKGFGLRDAGKPEKVDERTLFAIGSVTKWFTGLVVMRLEQDKKLALKDPISKFIPGVPADKKAITIKQLLAHTAGFGEYVDRPGEGGLLAVGNFRGR